MIWSLMLFPFLECLVLVGIHSYLGIHVLKRGIIFVDLAIAQVAALGIAVGMAYGVKPGTPGSYLFSLFFALTGALLFSLSRTHRKEIPQEALIGFIYAMATAVTFLVLSRASLGREHLEGLLMGNLLWVQGKEVLKAFIIYAIIGLLALFSGVGGGYPLLSP